MRAQVVITSIVLAILGAAMAGPIWWLGWPVGVIVGVGVVTVVVSLHVWVVRPFLMQLGATHDEIDRVMPGDRLVPHAESITRAITIDASPADVWWWLAQLGDSRAERYRDDTPSADRLPAEHQHLAVGDTIPIMPTTRVVVRSIDPPRSIVSVVADGSTSWCLAVYSIDGGRTRLVSRWRPDVEWTPATFLNRALAELGMFVMEQKLLLSIRERAESNGRTAHGFRPARRM